MWTLIKGLFWFSLVLVALPLFNPQSTERLQKGPEFKTTDNLIAAKTLYNDVTSICQREPDICDTGSHTLSVLGAHAKEGARIVYQFLDNQLLDNQTDHENPDRLTTTSSVE